MTRSNSARVSFVNRVKNGGFFAKATAVRGLRCGPRSVGYVRAPSRVGHASVLRVRGSGPRRSLMGHAVEFGFSFSSELVKVYSIHFLADLWKMIVNVVDVQK